MKIILLIAGLMISSVACSGVAEDARIKESLTRFFEKWGDVKHKLMETFFSGADFEPPKELEPAEMSEEELAQKAVYDQAIQIVETCQFDAAKEKIQALPQDSRYRGLFKSHYEQIWIRETRTEYLLMKAKERTAKGALWQARSALKDGLAQAKCENYRKKVVHAAMAVEAKIVSLHERTAQAIRACESEKVRALMDLFPPGDRRADLQDLYQQTHCAKPA